MGKLDNKVALVSGAARGQGRSHETALLVEKEGVRVHTAIVDVRERSAVWNTDMLHNDGMYRVFRPDLKAPTREEAETAFPAMQAMPIPYVEAQDVSNAVVFLASDDSRFITGTQFRVDGGGFVKAKPSRS